MTEQNCTFGLRLGIVVFDGAFSKYASKLESRARAKQLQSTHLIGGTYKLLATKKKLSKECCFCVVALIRSLSLMKCFCF